MKNMYNKISMLACLLFFATVTACEVFEVTDVQDPNRPTSTSVLSNASQGQIQDLITGLEEDNREPVEVRSGMPTLRGVFGRELYYFNESDPNFITAWLQLPGSQPAEEAPSFFVSGRMYSSNYLAVRQANLVIGAAENTDQLLDEVKNSVKGFAKTIKGYQLLLVLNNQFQNGIRIDVPFEEPLNPGPFLGYDEALAEIRAILDEGAADLANSNSFPFVLTGGLSDFDTPGELRQLNRAIAARAAVFTEDWLGALDALDESFLDLSEGEASMNAGAYFTFDGGNDILNPFFFPANADDADLIVVHPSMIDDAQGADLRVENKFFQRSSPASNSQLSGVEVNFQSSLIPASDADFPWIRNEELILIYAEAKAQRNQGTDLVDAVDAINLVRNTWNLGDFVSTSQSEIIDQVLFERRYSLWGEGHRWVDARRYDRLDEIPTDVDGGRIPPQLARPQGELDWEDFVGGN